MSEEKYDLASVSLQLTSEQVELIQAIDPVLDLHWQKKLTRLLTTLQDEERSYVFAKFIRPMGIKFNREVKQFAYDLDIALKDFIPSIRHPLLKQSASSLLKGLGELCGEREVTAFAEKLEALMAKAEAFDCENNLSVIKEKNLLRILLCQEAANIIRHSTWNIPESRRKIDLEQARSYFIDVFLKHQVLGYQLRPLPWSMLAKEAHPYLRHQVQAAAEAKQCDLIKAGQFLFVIAPPSQVGQDPYSAVRFFHEEKLLGYDLYDFSVVVIPLGKALDSSQTQEDCDVLLSRVAGAEALLSDSIKPFAQKLLSVLKTDLLPLLDKPIEAKGPALVRATGYRIDEFEKMLGSLVLQPFSSALKDKAGSKDDFLYLYLSLRNILMESAHAVRNFAFQSTAFGNPKAKLFDLKIMAMLGLLEKRRASIFSQSRTEEDKGSGNSGLTLRLCQTINEHADAAKEIQAQILELTSDKDDGKTGLMARLAKRLLPPATKPESASSLQARLDNVKRKCFLTLTNALKQFPEFSLFLEGELGLPVTEDMRHYAVAQGKDGTTALPAVFALHEIPNRLDFDELKALSSNWCTQKESSGPLHG